MKKNMNRIGWLCCVLILSGCVLHAPQAQRVTVLADIFGQNLELTEEGRVSTHRWWEMYGDEKLNQLMERGFAGNFDLQMAWARLQQAEALAGVARSNLFPTVSGSGATDRQRVILSRVNYQTHQLSLSASYELDVWQRLASERQALSLLWEASENDVQGVYVSLSAQIAETYYLVLELRAKVALNIQIVESFEKTVELVRLRYKRGVVSSLDLYQAKQNLLNAQTERVVFESDQTVAENNLALLLGFRPGAQDLGEFAVLPEVNRHYVLGLPSELLAHRPDVEAAYLRLQSADADIAEAVAERFPSFSLTANYGSQSSALSDLLREPNIFWNVLAGISAPLFDGGRRKANVRYKEARFRELLAAYHKAVIKAFVEVENSLALEHGMDSRYEQLQAYAEVTGATLRLSLQQYRFGLDTFLPVLTAQASHAKAQMAVVTAKRNKISSRIQLARALGGTWMVDEVVRYQAVNEDGS